MTRPLSTDRLALRAYAEGDVAAVRELYSLAAVQRSVTNPKNAPSHAVCARLGMRHLGLSSVYYDAACELFELVATPQEGELPRGCQP